MINPKWTVAHSLALFGLLAIIVIIDGTTRILFVTAYYLTLALLTVLAGVIGHGVLGLWRGILIDENDRISLSRFQLVLWTILLLSGLLAAAFGNLFRGLSLPPSPPMACRVDDPLGIIVSPNVWALMGITLTAAVASELVKQTNRMRGRPIIANGGPEDASWADLFMATEGTARRVDLTRVQNFYFTVVLVIAYGALLQQLFVRNYFICAFPELTSGMLTLLGISHAGYVVAKAIPRPAASTPGTIVP
ncbi:MAG: hypothetical protein C5B51_28135 [Terriglobia bacterium]|nr:MAG: hypothetical protein C5B51_28135 [Terriglobia bacterium]